MDGLGQEGGMKVYSVAFVHTSSAHQTFRRFSEPQQGAGGRVWGLGFSLSYSFGGGGGTHPSCDSVETHTSRRLLAQALIFPPYIVEKAAFTTLSLVVSKPAETVTQRDCGK